MTRTSGAWLDLPGRFDALNLRLAPNVERSECECECECDELGIPRLAPCSRPAPTELAAWHVARQRQHAAANGGAVHMFLDDYHFESVWAAPERMLPRAQAVGYLLSPDFSLWSDMPRAAGMWNVYRNRLIGHYWQSAGLDVVPTVSWSDESSFDYAFRGLPGPGAMLAIGTVGVRPRHAQGFVRGFCAMLESARPATILCYGRLPAAAFEHLPDDVQLVEYPTFWDRRRRAMREREAHDRGR